MKRDRQSNKKTIAAQLFRKLIELAAATDSISMITMYTYKPGEEIYRVGKNARSIFYISNGLVKLVRLQETGDEPLVRLSSEKEFLGILSLVKGYRYTATAIALNNVEAYKITCNFFTNALDSNYQLSSLFLQYLLETIYSDETRISELITKNVEERIAAALLSLYYQEGKVMKVTIPKKDLAIIAGTIQETVSRKLAVMARKGFIRLKGRDIILNDLNQLVRLSRIVN